MFVGILISVPTVRDKQPIKVSAVGGFFRFTRLVLISHKKKNPGNRTAGVHKKDLYQK